MHDFKERISTASFPEILKSAEVKPVFKKESRIDKQNYIPVSILPVISKIFERLIFKQLIMFFELVFYKYQCGFWKVHGGQHCQLVMIEKLEKCLDRNGTCGSLLTDLSKAFDCLPRFRLTA